MIRSFRRKQVQELFERGRRLRGLPANVQRRSVLKLQILHAARNLDDLKVPPGNRLEALKGDRKGQHSIRINDQFRICFAWRSGDAYNVDVVDYH